MGAAERIRRGGNRGLDLPGHVLDRVERVDARVRSGGDFRGRRGGIEAVAHQVLLGRRVELDGAVGTVVVGDHQPLRRDEARGAAAQRHHRAHRVAGEVGQLPGLQLQPGLLQRAGDFRQLLRHPHALASVDAADDTGQGGCHQRHCHRQSRIAHQ